MAHSYTWIAGSGAWTTASDWADLTAGQSPSTTFPGAADTASITGPDNDSPYVVTGPGNAASLTLDDAVALAGGFTAPSVTLATSDAGEINVLAGAVLSTASLAATSVTLSVDGAGAQILDSGVLSVQGFTQLAIANGGFVRAGSLTLSGEIGVDSTGTLEVGSVGGAPAGTISVDAGATLTAVGQFMAPVLLNGLVNGNSAIFDEGLSGTGTVSIGVNSSPRFAGSVSAGVHIAFAGIGGLLTVQSPTSFAATIGNFGAADTIEADAAGLTSVLYTGTAGGGALSLLAGTVSLGTLALSGSLNNAQFLLLPFDGIFGDAMIEYATNPATVGSAAPTGPSNSDAYRFATATGGAWNLAADWTDTTTGVTGAPPPGVNNAVTIASALRNFQIVNGNGNSASLTLTGQTALNGGFTTGTLTLAPVNESEPVLDLIPGAVLLDGGAATLGGTTDVDGSTLSVGGTLTASDTLDGGDINVFNGGLLRAGALMLGNGSSFSILGIDATSTVEIGTAGGATAGALTVDAGRTAALAGEVDGNLVVNGLISIGAGEYGIETDLGGTLSGTGTLQIGAGARVDLEGGAAAATSIAFGAAATLEVLLPGSLAAKLTGFSLGNAIELDTEVGSLAYTAATGALVATSPSGTAVGTLSVPGVPAGDSFLALTGIGEFGVTDTQIVLAAGTLVSSTAAPAGTASADSYVRRAVGGDWSTAANWTDATTGTTASIAPGVHDLVSIPDTSGAGDWQVISGAGNAASLTIGGNIAVTGAISTGALAVNSGTATSGADIGTLDVAAGAQLGASSAAIAGDLFIDGGIMTVAGTLTLGNAADGGIVSASDHGRLTASGLALGSALSYQSGALSADASSTIEIGSASQVAAGTGVAGALNIDAGITVTATGLELEGNLVNNGLVSLPGADAQVTLGGAVSGSGAIALGTGGYIEFDGAVASTQAVVLSSNDTVDLGTGALPTIFGFAAGDALTFDLDITGAVWSAGTLSLSTDGTVVETLALPGNYAGLTFIATPIPGAANEGLSVQSIATPQGTNSIAGGGDAITNATQTLSTGSSTVTLATVACYAAGTRIETEGGPVAVEALREGDRVRSAFGGAAPVVWLGHRRIDCARHPQPERVWPVRILAGAFADGLPRRDLRVSPDHALYVAGVLIPARCLVNGRSIVQDRVAEVTYWHVELPTHDVVLAEAQPAESYLDTGNRAAFANGGTVASLHPDFAQQVWEAEACAPQIAHGPILKGVIARLQARADAIFHPTGRRLQDAPAAAEGKR